MAWIVVFESQGKIYARASVSLSLYGVAKPYIGKEFSDMKILLDRIDVPDDNYEDIYGFVLELTRRRNEGEQIDVKSELERLVKEI